MKKLLILLLFIPFLANAQIMKFEIDTIYTNTIPANTLDIDCEHCMKEYEQNFVSNPSNKIVEFTKTEIRVFELDSSFKDVYTIYGNKFESDTGLYYFVTDIVGNAFILSLQLLENNWFMVLYDKNSIAITYKLTKL